MGLFDRRKETVPWRNSQGQIACSNMCTWECDSISSPTPECPIAWHTDAMSSIQRGDLNKALAQELKAVTIAPDFKDGWNNLGAIYGQSGNHSKAKDSYLKAVALDPLYANAMFGLAVSCKNLGQKQEALSWCDKCDRTVGYCATDAIRRQL